MVNSKYIAAGAMALSIAALYPEFEKINKSKDVRSYSKNALLFSISGSILWISYHAMEGQRINIVGAVFYLIMDLYILNLIK